MTGASTSANHVTATSNGSGPRATSHISGKSRMVEISKSGSGEGLGGVILRGYSKCGQAGRSRGIEE